MLHPPVPEPSFTMVLGTLGLTILSLALVRITHNLYFHPLAKFPGPWYAGTTSLASALISLARVEPEWLQGLVKKYGSDQPIRIAPNMLLFPRAADLKEIYWEPALNHKSELYGTGALGPPNLFTTLDGEVHRKLRKALGGSQWTIGALKNKWEARLDELITLFTEKMGELADAGQEVLLCDKVAEFAADFLTMLAFREPWGFVRHGRDERAFLRSWREGLDHFGLAGRWQWYRNAVLKSPALAPYFLPSTSDAAGMGYLARHADRAVAEREAQMEAAGPGWAGLDNPDLLQYCLEARFSDGSPLSPTQRRAHVTLLIMAGADTTGTAMGCTLRFLLTHPAALRRVRGELADADADAAGRLSRPVKYEESRAHLPFFGACIREALRLQPPAPNLFARVAPPGGRRVGGHFVPAGTEVTTNANVVHRDPALYGADADAFRPERWLDDGGPERRTAAALDAASFAFGIGPRVCLGKDVAYLELWKLLPEIIRNFDIELLAPGKYVVAGGVAFNEGLRVKLSRRQVSV